MQGHENDCENEKKWGFDLSHLYLLAVKFYKEKEGKALQLSYAARMEFVSLTQQVAHGPCRPDTLPQLGVLDIVGRDRREAWQRLGDMSRPDAMVRYIEMLDAACPIFRPFAEAHRRDLEAQERRREEERAAEEQRRRADERERLQRELELSRQAETKRRIQDGLNRQTYGQFRVYASQQYPGNPEQQAVLIRKLQQQHYQQYMQQLYQHQHRQQQQQQQEQQQQQQEQEHQQQASDPVAASDRIPDGDSMLPDGQKRLDAESTTHTPQLTSPSETDASDDSGQLKDDDIRRLAEAKMWIRGDLDQFKATIRSERTRGVHTVGQGQVVTVRVPARADGTCLFWEFATDGFDLGFGVWFEWGPTTQYEVTVEVSDGADEEQPPGGEGRAVSSPGQVAEDHTARTSCVVPVYRRDCHLHVYAGSHRFPAHEGVYLLKFDNSYSLWRAKTLYYRVFYTR